MIPEQKYKHLKIYDSQAFNMIFTYFVTMIDSWFMIPLPPLILLYK